MANQIQNVVKVIEGIKTFAPVIAILVSFVALMVSKVAMEKQLTDSLDKQSDWSKSLSKIASTYSMDLSDVCGLRARLRYVPNGNHSNEKYKIRFVKGTDELEMLIIEKKGTKLKCKYRNRNMVFEIMSDNISNYCDGLINKGVDEISAIDAEKIRIYCRFLLKNHWQGVQESAVKGCKDIAEMAVETMKLIDEVE